jgi:hypothetical protein
MAKEELVLLYQLDASTEKGLKAREILSRLNIRVKTVKSEMLSQSIGHLAGLPGYKPAASDYDGELIPDEVMLMKDLSDSRIDRLLKDFRAGGVSQIALKAVVTPHNQSWTLLELISELRSEHQIMERYSLLNQAVQAGDKLLGQVAGTATIGIALSSEGQALTQAIADGRAILRAKEAPELPVIDATLARLRTAIDNFPQ